MNINLELYKIFYYVAKNKSITRAANELLISQPAISKSIKTLESQMGEKLFIRKSSGVELSEKGKIIFPKIKESIELIDSAENDILTLQGNGKFNLNIAASQNMIKTFLMPYLENFYKIYPNMNIKIFTESPSEVIKKAQLGLIDIVFMNLPYKLPKEFETIKLVNLRCCLIANNEYYKLYKNIDTLENIPLLVLTKGTIARTELDNYFLKNKISINPKMELSSNNLIKEFTLSGFGVGIVEEDYVKKELAEEKLFKIPYKFPKSKRFFSLIYNKEKMNKKIVNTFIDFITKGK